jgi:hypothetical protein
MTRFKDVRITCEQIADSAKVTPDYVRRIMAQCKPKAVSESGEPLYSFQQMAAALIRGEPKENDTVR